MGLSFDVLASDFDRTHHIARDLMKVVPSSLVEARPLLIGLHIKGIQALSA